MNKWEAGIMVPASKWVICILVFMINCFRHSVKISELLKIMNNGRAAKLWLTFRRVRSAHHCECAFSRDIRRYTYTLRHSGCYYSN